MLNILFNYVLRKVIHMGIKKIIFMTLIVLIVLIIFIPYILMFFNPVRRPSELSRNYILRLTPIGMDMDDVIEILDGYRDWHINTPNYERGFSHPLHSSGNIVGVKSITAWGHPSGGGFWPAPIPIPIYGWFFRTVVSISWGFDEDGKLIDVFVRQSHSG